MVKPLSFKGDKKTKKRKRTTATDNDTNPAKSSSNALQKAEALEPDDSWVTCDVVDDISGPLLFSFQASPPICLACDATGKVFASKIENIVGEELSTAEPHDVRQVWVANRIVGTDKWTFKGHHGKYLGADKFGILSATKDAVSPEETFAPVPAPSHPGAFALQTARDTFISITENLSPTTNNVEIRADAETISFPETLTLRCQARFKKRLKASKEEKAREKISWKELEEKAGRKLDEEEVKRLKKAKRDGTFHEAILDVRVKGKHDKYS